jgi:hypothetical protein
MPSATVRRNFEDRELDRGPRCIGVKRCDRGDLHVLAASPCRRVKEGHRVLDGLEPGTVLVAQPALGERVSEPRVVRAGQPDQLITTVVTHQLSGLGDRGVDIGRFESGPRLNRLRKWQRMERREAVIALHKPCAGHARKCRERMNRLRTHRIGNRAHDTRPYLNARQSATRQRRAASGLFYRHLVLSRLTAADA